MWKKRLVLIGSVLLLVTATIAFKTINGKEQAVAAESSQKITVGDNQKLLSGQIAAINGNEITFFAKNEEAEIMTIPVGTSVYTKLGTTTTFSRLATGDEVSILIEDDGTESIVKVWITA